jgi:DNA-binding XRE family transcriptional regulator
MAPKSRLIRTRINLELREPCAVKVACTVLKGESGGNPANLLRIDKYITMDKKLNRIKTVLVDKGKTNKWLAEQLGKDPATISKWCTNKSQPSLVMMMTIAKLLQVELNDLVRLEEIADPIVKKKTEE